MFKFLRLWAIITIVSAASINLSAQQRDPAVSLKNVIIPPSPEATSLGRFGELPVTLNNGLVNVSIPIYQIKTQKQILPLTLEYHAAGVKPNDISSCIGLGWSLRGFFSISRVIKGMPDETDRGVLKNPFPEIDAPGEQDECFQFRQSDPYTSLDGQFDEFIYSLGTSSGKFIFKNIKDAAEPWQIYTIPETKLKINATEGFTKFTIVDIDGSIYTFDQLERTTIASSIGTHYTNIPSTWHVSSIISGDKDDTIRFTYTAPATVYAPSASRTMSYRLDGFGSMEARVSYSDNSQLNDHTTIYTDEILYRNGKVKFIYESDRLDQQNAKRLSAVKIYQRDGKNYNEHRQVVLNQSYFLASGGQRSKVSSGMTLNELTKKLRLDSVCEMGYSITDTIKKPPYKLDYTNPDQLPVYASTAQDFMGYYNGAHSNKNLLMVDYGVGQYGPEISTAFGANRSVNPAFLANGSLKKITYPTGGSTTLEMEANSIESSRIIQIPTYYNSPNYVLTTRDASYPNGITFTVSPPANAEAGTLKANFDFNLYNNISEPGFSGGAYVRDLTTGGYAKLIQNIGTTGVDAAISFPEATDQIVMSRMLELEAGHTYKMEFSVGPGYSETRNFMYMTVRWSVQTGHRLEAVTGKEYTGGLRIASLTDDDGDGKILKRNFIYKNGYYNSDKFNGDLYQMAALFQITTTHNYWESTEWVPVRYNSFGENFSFSVGSSSGTVASYGVVEEIRVTASGRPEGKKVYRYNTAVDEIPSFAPIFRADREWRRGQVRAEEYHKYDTLKGFIKIKEIINNYDYTEVARIRNYWAMIVKDALQTDVSPMSRECPERNLTVAFRSFEFFQPVHRSNLTSRVTNDFDKNGENPLSIVEQFEYNNPLHNQVTKTSLASSDKKLKITSYKYPLDYTTTNCWDLRCFTDFENELNSLALNRKNREREYYLQYLSYKENGSLNQATAAFNNYMACRTEFHNTIVQTLLPQFNNCTQSYETCMKDYLASGASDQAKAINMLRRDNVVTTVLEEIQSVIDGTSEYVTDAILTDYKPVGETAMPYAIWALNSHKILKDIFSQNPSSNLRKVGSFDRYDSQKNITQRSKTNDVTTSFSWGYEGQFPIAKVTNATVEDIAYTSFEPSSLGGWSLTTTGIVSNAARTGIQAYDLSKGLVRREGLNTTKTYLLTMWAKAGSSILINGALTSPIESSTVQGWRLYQMPMTGISSVSITGTGIIDELRCFPINAQMTTYTYDPKSGVTSVTDSNNRVTYYGYDILQRLSWIKDDCGAVLKTYKYSYK